MEPAVYELKIVIHNDGDPSKNIMPTYDIERKMDETFHPMQLLVLHGLLEQQQKDIMNQWDTIIFMGKKGIYLFL